MRIQEFQILLMRVSMSQIGLSEEYKIKKAGKRLHI